MSEPIRIGNRRQLFLDGSIVQRRERLERRVCPVRKHPDNPVIRPEHDWEPGGYIHRTVLYDEQEQVYKAWCSGFGRAWRPAGEGPTLSAALFYFTSEDGIHWRRPELDVFPISGCPTNIVAMAAGCDHPNRWPFLCEPFGVSKDTGDPDPQRRYKLGFLHLTRDYQGPDKDPYHKGSRRGLGVAFSPDGINWTPMEKPVTWATCDGMTQWMRDPRSGRFVLYGRTKHYAPEVLNLYGDDPFFRRNNWGRAVRRAESEDFVHWTPDEGELILSTDALDGPGEEIYGLCVFPWEGIYVGLVQMFHNYEDHIELDFQLAVSHDGVRFDRLSDRSPFIPVGGVGSWDRFNNNLSSSLPVRMGDELRFYYGGRNYLHAGAHKGPDNGREASLRFVAGVGLGAVKLDRFAALEATFDPGTLYTEPILVEGDTLHVNAAVPFGVLDVAVLDESARPIDGVPPARIAEQDGVDLDVPIDNFAALRDRPVRLQFTLRNGRLYSFGVGPRS